MQSRVQYASVFTESSSRWQRYVDLNDDDRVREEAAWRLQCGAWTAGMPLSLIAFHEAWTYQLEADHLIGCPYDDGYQIGT